MQKKTDKDVWIVKLSRATWTTIIFMGTKAEATAQAKKLNEQYQTDEYVVDKFNGVV